MIENAERLKDIICIDSELNRIQDLDILLEKILYEVRKAVNADAGSIYIKQGDSLSIVFSQNDTLQKELQPGKKLIYNIFSIAINEKTISGYAAKTGKLVNIPDVYQLQPDSPYQFDPTYDKFSDYTTMSVLAVPLITNRNEILGVLQLINSKDSQGTILPFHADDELFAMHFAQNVTIALQRAQLTRSILLRMISMAELRDPKETGAHVNRVAGYAAEIYERWAQKMQIPETESQKICDILRMAAMLHDVGKVAISDIILKKPGAFTPEEYAVIKSHTWLGAKLFSDKQSELDEIAFEVALNHHENWDGTGYPGKAPNDSGEIPLKTQPGKSKEEIPLFGRIVAIADVFDALSSKRVYKEAWDEQKVLSEMQNLSGKKFDPFLLEIFFEIYPQIKQVAQRYPE